MQVMNNHLFFLVSKFRCSIYMITHDPLYSSIMARLVGAQYLFKHNTVTLIDVYDGISHLDLHAIQSYCLPTVTFIVPCLLIVWWMIDNSLTTRSPL